MDIVFGLMLFIIAFLAIFALIAAIYGKEAGQGCLTGTLALIVDGILVIIAGLMLCFCWDQVKNLLCWVAVVAGIVVSVFATIVLWEVIARADEVHVLIVLTVILVPVSIALGCMCLPLGLSTLATNLLAWLCIWNPWHILG